MARLWRRALLLGGPALATGLAVAALAWACTPHEGVIWFCEINSTYPTGNCPEPSPSSGTQQFQDGSLVAAKGDGLLDDGIDYVLKYVVSTNQDLICAVGGTVFTNGSGDPVIVTTDGSRNFGPVEVRMPAVAGVTWEACAVHLEENPSPPDVLYASNHRTFATI